MKSLLTICAKSAKVTSKDYLGNMLIGLFSWVKLLKVMNTTKGNLLTGDFFPQIKPKNYSKS